MKKLFIYSVLLASIISLNCATILKGTHEDVAFTSSPEGAEVRANGMYLGVTPLKFPLETKNVYQIEITKQGFEKKNLMLNRSLNGGFLFLDIIFGIIPVVVDAGNGAWYNFDSNTIFADFKGPDTSSVVIAGLKQRMPAETNYNLNQDAETVLFGGEMTVRHKSGSYAPRLEFKGNGQLYSSDGAIINNMRFVAQDNSRYTLKIANALSYRMDIKVQGNIVILSFFRQ